MGILVLAMFVFAGCLGLIYLGKLIRGTIKGFKSTATALIICLAVAAAVVIEFLLWERLVFFLG